MNKIISYLESVLEEMKKVSWPSWLELKSSTWMVVGLTIFLAAVVFVYDKVMNSGLGMILR